MHIFSNVKAIPLLKTGNPHDSKLPKGDHLKT